MLFEVVTRSNIFKAGCYRFITDIHGVFTTSFTNNGFLIAEII